MFKIKKDLRSTKFQGNRSTTPISIRALKKHTSNEDHKHLIGLNAHNSMPKEDPTMVNIQLEGNFAGNTNQLTHGPPPSKISE